MSTPLSILVVDDNLSLARSLKDILEVKGYTVHVANSGAEALKILDAHPVDILLTDVIMEGMNGLELYLAAREAHPRLVTFLMTAYAADDLIQQGMRAGIRTVLNKPLDIDLVLMLFSAHARLFAESGPRNPG
jgi:CheY-like chemotaxis protein